MLTVRLIPCLDVRHGRVVKGIRFGGLRDVGSPAVLADAYERIGADELVVLDVSATPDATATNVDTVRAVRAATCIPVTVGGGIRTVTDADALLAAGADKVAVNTACVKRPGLISDLAGRFGAQCVVVSIDAACVTGGRDDTGAKNGYEVVVRSGRDRTGMDAVDWARRSVDLGAGEILLTSWDRDGTRQGYDTSLIEAVASAASVPVVASGGAANPDDMLRALTAGAHAVLAASIFHDGDYSIPALKTFLTTKGVAVRPC